MTAAGTPPGRRRHRSARRPPVRDARSYVTSVAALEAAAAGAARRLPGPVAARVLAQGERRAGRGRAARRRWGWTRTSSRRGEWAAARRGRDPERADHARGRRQDGRRTCGRRCAPPRPASRCGGSRSRARRSSTRWRSLAARAGAGTRRAPPRWTCCCGSTRTSRPETHAGLAVGRGVVQVRHDRDGAHGGGRRRSARDGPLRAARHPPPRRLAAGRGGRLAGRRAARARACWRWSGPGAPASTRSTWAAASRWASPGRCRRRRGSRREVPALLEAIPRRAAARRLAVEPGTVPRRARRAGSSRPCCTSASGPTERRRGAGRGHDGADPAGAVRGAAPDRGADLARDGRVGRPRPSARRPGRRRRRPGRVDGPVCESTDTFGHHDLPPLRRGDLVAIADAGAYAASMALDLQRAAAAPAGAARGRRTARARSTATTRISRLTPARVASVRAPAPEAPP